MSTGALDTILSVFSPVQEKLKSVQEPASLLWLYKNNNTIAGVPVVLLSRKITFAKQLDMMQAMLPVTLILVFTGYLSPLNKLDVLKYRDIRQLVALGSAAIISEDKQFVADKSAFMYIVVYCKYSYKLNLRYNFYRLDFEDGKRETTV